MLQKLNTSFFYKNIFININEKRKLLLIKYNKNLQNILDIKLINYITLSGKFLKQETKEKIKIYVAYNTYADILIFEGNYYKGIGKEYNSFGNIIYEGEYLNGKRNGNGKVYYINGKVLFEGEFLNGKKFHIKEYDKNGNVIYELKNGNGFIKEYGYNLNLIFEGNYLNGERNGKGKEYFNNKII